MYRDKYFSMKQKTNKTFKEYFDSLSDAELLFEIELRFGITEPVYEECSKEEYEKNVEPIDKFDIDSLIKSLFKSSDEYKKEPRWNNVKPGIMWQIKHGSDNPDYYVYYKKVKDEHILMLNSWMIDYLNNRKPSWYNNEKQETKDK